MKIKLLFIFFPLFLLSDHIQDFHSNIKINKDRTIEVVETINFYLNRPRTDFLRLFPTDYSRDGFRYIVPFNVLDVKLNDKEVKFFVSKYQNGYELKVGDASLFDDISKDNPKNYVLEIKYQTQWQIGFFNNHDELYWNVTGNGWPYEIKHASAEVVLPSDINILDITSYYGRYGSRYKASGNFLRNTAFFKSVESLLSGEGLTIAVSWPKGLIKEPSSTDFLLFYLKNNYDIALTFLMMILVLIYFIFIYFKTRIKKEIVIPLFDAPEGLLPFECSYILNKNFNYKGFSSSIVDMAVRGYLTIDYKQRTLMSSVYTFDAVQDVQVKEEVYQKFYKYLFIDRPFLNSTPKYKFKVSGSNWQILENCFNYSRNFLRDNFDKYWNSNIKYWCVGFIPSLALVVYLFISSFEILAAWILAAILLALNILFLLILKEYTVEGEKIRAQVEGFKMFLSFTEKERLKYTACPEKTPEQYETYLSYAIAFGIEELWTRQFSSLFKMLEEKGSPYSPSWYYGHGPFRPRIFLSSFSSAVASSSAKISSSSYAPGSKSGFGGGGFSGGGGGGGGGR